MAIKAGGSLWAWGSNKYGQLGDGTAWYDQPMLIVAGEDSSFCFPIKARGVNIKTN